MSSANTGECVTTGGLYRPTHLCVAHFELHKKTFQRFFCDVVRLGVFGGGTTPFSQLCHFLSVVRFIVVADETYH